MSIRFLDTLKKTLYQGDIVLDDDEGVTGRGLGRSDTNNIPVLLWPRKLWRTRQVPYLISGQSYDAISKLPLQNCPPTSRILQNCPPPFDMTRKICLKVRYFDLGSGERNLIQFLIWFLFIKSFAKKNSNKGRGFFYNGKKKPVDTGRPTKFLGFP